MKESSPLRTRRRFLNRSMLGAATSLTIPAFLEQTMVSLHAEAEGKTQATTGKDDTILVVLQLAGGNDGLNTLVPHSDDAYYQARPTLGLKSDSLHTINDYLGFNENLGFFHELYQNGQLGVVQGVGYPNPNRSHFRSTEIWQTATDADAHSQTGWLGRYFDSACAGADPDPTVGVAITQKQPQSFQAAANPGISVSQPELYRWIQGKGQDELAEGFFREFNRPEDAMMNEGNTGDSIGELSGGKMQTAESNLDYLERVALDAQVSSDHILKIASEYRGGGKSRAYPGGKLGQSLKLVSQMIAGGLGTRVYYVSHGGFDTHNNQPNSHGRLLTELNDSVRAFMKDLAHQGNAERVLLMTFSEFGRRVAENANSGTDHGAAAPLFVMGGPVKGGLYGKHPSLTDLHRGDLKFTTDFRSVYRTVLDGWLNAPGQELVGKPFEKLGFL